MPPDASTGWASAFATICGSAVGCAQSTGALRIDGSVGSGVGFSTDAISSGGSVGSVVGSVVGSSGGAVVGSGGGAGSSSPGRSAITAITSANSTAPASATRTSQRPPDVSAPGAVRRGSSADMIASCPDTTGNQVTLHPILLPRGPSHSKIQQRPTLPRATVFDNDAGPALASCG